MLGCKMLTTALCTMQEGSDSEDDESDDEPIKEWDDWMNVGDAADGGAAGPEQQSKRGHKQQQQQSSFAAKRRKVGDQQQEFEVPGQGPAQRQGGRKTQLPAKLRY
jgi:hypothetical protein